METDKLKELIGNIDIQKKINNMLGEEEEQEEI